MTMPPDQAALRFSISDKGRSLDLIKNNVGNITSRFLEFAENLGIKKQNLRTTNINIFQNILTFRRQVNVFLMVIELIGT